jgi:rhodanese-related sulfurtransferase/rubrerythrin
LEVEKEMSEQLTNVGIMFPDDAETFISQNPESTFIVLDVRQPFEYESEHLPGAKLIPLPELVDSLQDLDPGKTIIVYCAVGGRSRMAAQLLANQDFRKVYYVEGGMEAWEGPAAEGPREFHLQFIKGDEAVQEVIALSYKMERGLRTFHETVKSKAKDPELVELLGHLIKAEESHMKRLLAVSVKWGMDPDEVQTFEENLEATVMEGGIDMRSFLVKNESFLQSVAGVIDVAMMVETQALDLYLRMAAESNDAATKEVLFEIAEEEKAHLRALGRVLEDHLSKST